MKIANFKLIVVLIVVLLAAVIVPVGLSAASAADKPFRYEDERLGEKKDESDKFKFTRVKLGPNMMGGYLGDRGEPWSHDYPEAGLHLSKILSELSKLQVVLDEDEYIFSFEDPNLMKYPFAYMCEVGYMQLTDGEIHGMREYLLRGGFLLVDDFRGSQQMRNFEYYVKQAFPEREYQIKPLDITHPIFNCFFSIKTLDVRPPYDRGTPQFLGLEDKHGRLMMIINFTNDVSDYWQWSGDPFNPLPAEDTQGAYKFGVNYVFYALTH
ncbi:MAG TPA: DUF4159 domain-containing protein [Blastocatellia bacterium]|nr:DUF4159 domain-containing protein [Blastocatellia bacterium]